MPGKKPEKKPFGRTGPPAGYPKDQSLYADPENWRYPCHTPHHAKAARRYFDEWSNRSKYTEEERQYIDWRIDEALKRFATEPRPGKGARLPPRLPSTKKVEDLSRDELLKLFLGAARYARMAEIDNSLIRMSRDSSTVIEGNVKDYTIRIDVMNRQIVHDCQDWLKNMQSKRMCKHLGKFMQSLEEKRATDLLRGILVDRDRWSFSSA